LIKIDERGGSVAYPRTRNIKFEVVSSDILISGSRADLADKRIVAGIRSLAVWVPRQDPQAVRELNDRVSVGIGGYKVVDPGGYANRGEAFATIVDPIELESEGRATSTCDLGWELCVRAD
jgi:hypothetical protein